MNGWLCLDLWGELAFLPICISCKRCRDKLLLRKWKSSADEGRVSSLVFQTGGNQLELWRFIHVWLPWLTYLFINMECTVIRLDSRIRLDRVFDFLFFGLLPLILVDCYLPILLCHPKLVSQDATVHPNALQHVSDGHFTNHVFVYSFEEACLSSTASFSATLRQIFCSCAPCLDCIAWFFSSLTGRLKVYRGACASSKHVSCCYHWRCDEHVRAVQELDCPSSESEHKAETSNSR